KKAIEKVRPYAVDVASGVESEPGRKDYKLLEKLITAIKRED
ncbi:MAG: phosphoribosylanthranilate isomerase, partial [Candidatus Omnitrophica bacterium]|nr:phosphoribosylanthranilate isomerase [Candidatus Omnitrophota bacterium]